MSYLKRNNPALYLSELDVIDMISKQLQERNNPKRARIALKALFQVLREHLPQERSRTLLSMLPNPLLVTFVEGWRNEDQSNEPIDCVEGMIEAYRKRRAETRPDKRFSAQEAAKEIQVLLEVITSLMDEEDAQQLHEILPCKTDQFFSEMVHVR